VTTIRRTLVVLATVLTVLVGLGAASASAAFSDQAGLTASVGTLTVAPPATVTTNGTYCSSTTWYSYGTWYSSSTLHAKVSWSASTTTRGVSGYRVTAWFADGSTYPVGDVAAGTTSVTMDVDGSYASQGIRITVTTLTSYGWTAQSARSAAITC